MLLSGVFATGLLVNAVSASYVQSRHCRNAADDEFDPSSMSIVMKPGNHESSIDLNVRFLADMEQCRAVVQDLRVHVEMEALGWSLRLDDSEASLNCTALHFDTRHTYLEAIVSSQRLGGLYPLATFNIQTQLLHQSGRQLGCVQGNVVPAPGTTTVAALRWAPFAVLMVVLSAGIALTIHDQRTIPHLDAASDRPILPRVGDCLQYLQFIFLTGCLSIQYPGFFQSAVSKLEWYSLFSTIPVARGQMYLGVNDGIYEMNGTYGGTYGLEIMHQIVGAPPTMDTWLNMVITLLFVAIGAALLLEGLRWWQRRSISHVFHPPTEWQSDNLWQRFSRVLRIIFSYFTTPVVAISCYQLANATRLPMYHTAMAIALIALVVAGFVWLLCRVPTRTLGVLVFDSSKRYQPLSSGDDPVPQRHTIQRHTGFILVLFGLAFIRGAAIGGLQLLGLVQLAILVACELILLASMYGFRTYSIFSLNTVAAVCRLSTLILMVLFLPGIQISLKAKSALGYAILLTHLCMLVFGFFGTACYDIWQLFCVWTHVPQPNAHGLDELRRRDNPTTNISTPHLLSSSPHSPVSNREPSPHGARRNTLYEGSITDPDRYFRTPRPSSLRSSRSLELLSLTLGPMSPATPTLGHPHPTSRAVSPLAGQPVSYIASPTETDSTAPGCSDTGTATSQSGARSLSQDGDTHACPAEDHYPNSTPLGPRWKDYTFRESDLFYGAAPKSRPSAGRGAGAGLDTNGSSHSSLTRPSSSLRTVSGMWSKLTGRGAPKVREKGFSVARASKTGHSQDVCP